MGIQQRQQLSWWKRGHYQASSIYFALIRHPRFPLPLLVSACDDAGVVFEMFGCSIEALRKQPVPFHVLWRGISAVRKYMQSSTIVSSNSTLIHRDIGFEI